VPHTGQPDEARRLGRTATVYRFSIPAVFDGHAAAIEGHVTWIPAPINLEIPLLFVPLVVVDCCGWSPSQTLRGEDRQERDGAGTGRRAVEAARILVDVRSGAEGGAALAPLAVLPGLVLVTTVASRACCVRTGVPTPGAALSAST